MAFVVFKQNILETVGIYIRVNSYKCAAKFRWIAANGANCSVYVFDILCKARLHSHNFGKEQSRKERCAQAYLSTRISTRCAPEVFTFTSSVGSEVSTILSFATPSAISSSSTNLMRGAARPGS